MFNLVKVTSYKLAPAGDLNESIGFGYKKPLGTDDFVLTGKKLSGEPIKIGDLTKIEVRYKLNRTTGKYEINTMFPIE